MCNNLCLSQMDNTDVYKGYKFIALTLSGLITSFTAVPTAGLKTH